MPRSNRPSEPQKQLSYRIELCDADNADIVERVLGRALSVTLARAIFSAARGEYPERRIRLRKGSRIVADSAD